MDWDTVEILALIHTRISTIHYTIHTDHTLNMDRNNGKDIPPGPPVIIFIIQFERD